MIFLSFGTFVLDLIIFIFILGLIIVIHELGHFLLAKKSGILCHEFSIGMGPCIYKHQFKETTFCIRAIPFGGYVSMAGEEVTNELIKKDDEIGLRLENGKITKIVLDEKADADVRGKVCELNLYGKEDSNLFVTLSTEIPDENKLVLDTEEKKFECNRDARYLFEHGKELQIAPYDRCFESKKWYQRFLTIFFGPFMNFVLAIFIYLLYWTIAGVPNVSSSQIGAVVNNAPGSTVLVDGDIIKDVDGTAINSWTDFSNVMNEVPSQGKTSVNMKIERNGQITEVTVPYYIIINSCGISNIENSEKPLDHTITGAVVGNVNPNYTEKLENPLLSYGDVITKLYIDIPDSKGNFDGKCEESYDITGWSDLMKILNEQDVVNIYFDFYDIDTNKEITYKEGQTVAIQTYGNELLNSQSIIKVQTYIGISPTTNHNFFKTIGYSFSSFWSDFTLIFRTLKVLIAPSEIRQVGINSMSSVIGIFGMVEQVAAQGALALMAFTAMISVNIGVMNLLPIPALDGGRILFLIIEGITRKKLPKKVENTINNAMMIILFIFFIYLCINDVIKLAGLFLI